MTNLVLGDRPAILEVFLVHDQVHRDVARNLERGGDPFVQGVQAILPSEIAHTHQSLRAMVVRLPDEVLESPLTHDVEDRHVHLDLGVCAVGDRELDLTHPGPDRVEIGVLVLVEDEPPDQGGLADAPLSHQGELCLHVSDCRHRENPGGSSFGARV